jgi:hypothetical protein
MQSLAGSCEGSKTALAVAVAVRNCNCNCNRYFTVHVKKPVPTVAVSATNIKY